MATYVNIYAMAEDATFRKQVITACRKAAWDILNEDPGTANHTARLVWTSQVLGYNGVAQADVVQGMIVGATSNATLQAAAPSGPWVDGDVQFVVNSLIDIQAGSA